MSLSIQVKKNLTFLHQIQPEKFTITGTHRELKAIGKRSKFCNFLHWVIHYITCKRVARNEQLDQLTMNILKNIKREITQDLPSEEKVLAKKALNNLIKVIENNGGSKQDAVSKAIKKIRGLSPAILKVEKENKEDEAKARNKDQDLVKNYPDIEEVIKDSRDKTMHSLMNLLDKRPSDDRLMETIFKYNPYPEDESNDLFFEELLNELIKGTFFEKELDPDQYNNASNKNRRLKERLKKVAVFILQNDSEKHKQIFIDLLHPSLLAPYLEHIPFRLLENDQPKLLKMAIEAIKTWRIDIIEDIAKAVKPESLDMLLDAEHASLCTQLLTFFDPPLQVQILRFLMAERKDYHDQLREEAQKLKPSYFAEASKLIPLLNFNEHLMLDYPSELLTQIVNGQANNQKFLFDFFKTFFCKTYSLEKQKLCVQKLKPEVFEFAEPYEVEITSWQQFFRVLTEIEDKEHAKNLLISATRNLFNAPGFHCGHKDFFYALKKEQIDLLPINEYTKPEIRLLIASLSHRLDDTLIESAVELFGNEINDFFTFAQMYYEESDCLETFITWLVDRESITPLVVAWNWINNYTRLMFRGEIVRNAYIQDCIRDLNLETRVHYVFN